MRDLTPAAFDRVIIQQPRPSRLVWTASAIGARIGRSADYVRDTLSRMPGSPVRKVGSQYVTDEHDLLAFFRGPGK